MGKAPELTFRCPLCTMVYGPTDVTSSPLSFKHVLTIDGCYCVKSFGRRQTEKAVIFHDVKHCQAIISNTWKFTNSFGGFGIFFQAGMVS